MTWYHSLLKNNLYRTVEAPYSEQYLPNYGQLDVYARLFESANTNNLIH